MPMTQEHIRTQRERLVSTRLRLQSAQRELSRFEPLSEPDGRDTLVALQAQIDLEAALRKVNELIGLATDY